ncbi:GNAT family N-acetyltransferase [Tritonibacter horizontis]|uniref:N-acyltransferase YncA n=1 Tax=Tritonibacter horizontis TaxID=1768241 RepID=A0A132BTN4_9RHOB|nr:GNAT family N-acetyltransferase [Tritonibacter horizontis]KUP91110.1 N-acyltransferase YncA [Tritonibacter horizontis]
MTVILRRAEGADAPAIADLHGEIVETSLATFTTDRRPLSTWRELIETERRVLVATAAAEAEATDAAEAFLGFAAISGFRSGPGYAQTGELSIYLTKAAQGCGTGRKLLAELENLARDEGLHVLVAAISSANPAAEAFHTACGYRVVGRLPEVGLKWGRWLDLVLMQKNLRERGTA